MPKNARTQLPDRPVDVLYSFGPPADEANPYVRLLVDSISPGAVPHYFSWKFALLGSYDAFHVHWPEALVRRRTLPKRAVSQALLLLLLGKLAITRTPIVRTEHNVRPHESGSWTERTILGALDKSASAWIVMNTASSGQRQGQNAYVPHGHYRDWYKSYSAPVKRPGTLLNFGLIRPYKGVEELVIAFKALPKISGLKLMIMGKPQNAESSQALLEAIGDTGIEADLRHIPDPDLTAAVAQASLVVLPYRAMHNSGALLLALSLGTPVLVPKNEMTDSLAAEVGEQWVQRFEGTIGPETLRLAAKATESILGLPDLSHREWREIGNQHVRLYRQAVGVPLKDDPEILDGGPGPLKT